MAEVGAKRSPRLPKGPPQGLDDDDVVISEELKAEVVTEEKKEEGEFRELTRAKIPEPPTKMFRDKDSQVLYDYLASLKPEHWVQLSWYLYRIIPIIVRPDEQKYIECNVIPLTQEYIVKNHGSGDYKLIVNDSGKPKGAKALLTAVIKINDIDHPPLLNYAELDVDHPSNKRFVEWSISKGLLTVDKKPMNQVQQGGTNNDQLVRLLEKLIDKTDKRDLSKLGDPTDTAINKAFEVMARGNEAATKMILDQMKDNDPDKLLKMVTMIMTLVKPQEQKSNSDESMMMKFISLLTEKDNKMMSMMEKMFELTAKVNSKPATTEGEDAFDKTIDRYLKIQELTGAVGGGGGGKKSTLEVIMQYGMPVADKAFGIIMNLLALKANNVPPGVQTQTPVGANAPPVQNLPMPVSVATDEKAGTDIAAAMGDGTAHTEVGRTTEGGVVVNEAMIRQGLLQMAPMLIGALDRGQPGDQFAEGVNTMYGPKAYDLVAGIGRDKMLEYLKSEPQIWQHLAVRERAVVKFIADFIAYGTEDDDTTIPPDDGNNPDEGGEPGKEGADGGKPISTKRGVIN